MAKVGLAKVGFDRCCVVVVWLLSCCCGVVVVLLWCCCGVVVVLLWCCCVVVVVLLCCCCGVVVVLLCCCCGVVVVEWLYYSKRIVIVRWADLSEFFFVHFRWKNVYFCFTVQ